MACCLLQKQRASSLDADGGKARGVWVWRKAFWTRWKGEAAACSCLEQPQHCGEAGFTPSVARVAGARLRFQVKASEKQT